MSAEKIRDRSVDELNNKLQDLKEELFHLRFQNAINQLENPMRIKAVRKDIARIKTVLHEIELDIVRTSKVMPEKVEKTVKPAKEDKKAVKEQAEEEQKEAPKVRKPRKKKVEEPVAEAAVQETDTAPAESQETEE